MTDADFEVAWKAIDLNKDGFLTLNELAAHYGYNLSPSAKRPGDADMSDEQILEALQVCKGDCNRRCPLLLDSRP